MDGCDYQFKTTIETIGEYTYYLNCTVGDKWIIDGTYNGQFVEESIFFDGMYLIYSSQIFPELHFKYTHMSENFFNVSYSDLGTGSITNFNIHYTEDIQKRTNDFDGFPVWLPGTELIGNTPFIWIYTNVSLGDNISINLSDGINHIFNVSKEDIYELSDIGAIEVWILEDMTSPGCFGWYEKETGFLLKGYFQF